MPLDMNHFHNIRQQKISAMIEKVALAKCLSNAKYDV